MQLVKWSLAVLSLLFVSVASGSGRDVIPFDGNWRFALQPKGSGFQSADFADAAWSHITLPHTWNAIDGQDGGTYVRGDGWYRKSFASDPAWQGKRVFIAFDAVGRVADVYLNGRLVGSHAGPYGRFRFDLTDFLQPGENLLAVRANNEGNNLLPIKADFTLGGGIYRDVRLIVVSPAHIALRDYGSPGVYLTTETLDDDKATLAVRTLLENTAAPVDATVEVTITDAEGAIVATSADTLHLAASATHSQRLAIAAPRRWLGRADPYLYTVTVALRDGDTILDSVTERTGLRTTSFDPQRGFFLNGERYDLHGVNYHQDKLDRGNAVSAADRIQDFDIMDELGVTAIRFAHYEHGSQAYDLCDQRGIVAWAEFNLHFDVPTEEDLPGCLANALDQCRELIRQNYNHPSIVCWSIGDETGYDFVDRSVRMLRAINDLAKTEDPTRVTTYASNHEFADPRNAIADTLGLNPYFGWYYQKPAALAEYLDTFHRDHPAVALAVSEYGGGASIYQHEQNPPYRNVSQAKGPWHPEEWLDEIHEQTWPILAKRQWLWGNFVWVMFDFASERRKEGDHWGRNDKGLVTYDRRDRKDSFYWYKSHWNEEPLVYVTSRRHSVRLTPETDVKVYSNCDTVELWINEVSQGEIVGEGNLFVWPGRMLSPGANRISVEGRKPDGTRVTDHCYWTCTTGQSYVPPADTP